MGHVMGTVIDPALNLRLSKYAGLNERRAIVTANSRGRRFAVATGAC